jgi:hypothetical protein
MSHLWLCAVSFPAQYAQGFGEIVCHYCPSPSINEATSPTPMPLIKSLLPRPLPRSFELPKSCRECLRISQSAFLPAKAFFHQAVLTPASPQRSSCCTCSSLTSQVNGWPWPTPGFPRCASSQRSHGTLNLIPRAAAMYITRNKFMHISSSTDTTRYCLLNHKIHRCPTNGSIKMRTKRHASDKSLH